MDQVIQEKQPININTDCTKCFHIVVPNGVLKKEWVNETHECNFEKQQNK